MTPDRHSTAAARSAGYEAEAAVAELTEVLETQTVEIARLRREIETLGADRERLETELVLARSWVKELADRVDEAEARLADAPSTLRSRLAQAGRPPG